MSADFVQDLDYHLSVKQFGSRSARRFVGSNLGLNWLSADDTCSLRTNVNVHKLQGSIQVSRKKVKFWIQNKVTIALAEV